MFYLLSPLTGGIVGGFIGVFVGGFAKFFWENWLPSQLTWRHQQHVDREKLLSQFRDPAMRAIIDLHNRIFHILTRENLQYLRGIANEDYYIISTTFLIAQYFAWVEILFRKAAMLDYYKLTNRLEKVGLSFSNGTPGLQIFHLEQREIGERMLISSPHQNGEHFCLGYADFIDLLGKETTLTCFSVLEGKVRELTTEDLLQKQTILKRLIVTQHTLIDLMDFIDPHRKWTRGNRKKLHEEDTLLRQLISLRKQEESARIAEYKASLDEQ